MFAIKLLALAVVAFCSTSWASTPNCDGPGEIKMADGYCISDPTITPAQPVPVSQPTSAPTSQVGGSPNYPGVGVSEAQLIYSLCQTAPHPASCEAVMSDQARSRIAAEKKAAKDKAAGEQAAAPPAAPPGGGGGGNSEEKGGQEEGGDQQAANEEQPSDSSGQGEGGGDQNHPGKAHAGECVQKVMELAQVCSKKKEEAGLACDEGQSKDVMGAIATGDRRAARLSKGGAAQRDADIMGAVDNKTTSDAYGKFGASCKEKHVSCESECDSVRKTYDALCKDPKKQSQVAQKVQKAEEERLVCRDEYGQTAKNAAAQSKGSNASGRDAASSTKQSDGSGASQGMDPAALMKGFEALAQKKDKEEEKQEAADKTMAELCQSNSTYANSAECKCLTNQTLCGAGISPIRGLSSDSPILPAGQ